MKLFDSHAHYEDSMFNDDCYERLDEIKDSDVSFILNCCSDESVFDTIMDIVDKYPYVYGSIGIHPHWSTTVSDNYIEKIKELAENKKIVALGEMGLDYYWHEPKDIQRKVFIEQLQLAKLLDMPVIIHDREAHQDTMEILKEYQPKAILHRYGGPVDLLQQAFDMGMYVSFNNDLTYPEWNQPHIDCLMATPWERMLVETDCPYAPPADQRERRCQSEDVYNVVKQIAKLRNVSEEFVADITCQNAIEFYDIKQDF